MKPINLRISYLPEILCKYLSIIRKDKVPCIFRQLIGKMDLFKKTELRLTLQYTLAFCFLSFSFALTFYLVTYFNLQSELNQKDPQTFILVSRFLTSFNQVPQTLITVYILVVLLSGLWGYYMSSKALKPIKENMEAQKKFFADASHELRTPLTVMKADLEITLRKQQQLSGICTNSLYTTLQQVNRMSSIVDDFLTLSRLDNNQDPLQLENLQLNALLSSTIKQLEPILKDKDIKIDLNDFPISYVYADGDKLHHAFFHLLKNAIDFSYSGQSVEVLTKVDHLKKMAEIRIVDHGAGISKEDLPFVFKRFYKVNKPKGVKINDNGLSLSLAKSIIEKHRGVLTVDSQIGQGTKVTTHLPLAS